MSYIEPTARILQVRVSQDTLQVRVELDRVPSTPIAPAGLYATPNSNEPDYELQKLERLSGLTCEFRTFQPKGNPPEVGAIYTFRSWWNSAAMSAALDLEANWTHRQYPNDGTHDHCLFTWETLSNYSGHKVGWWSEKHGWITDDAHANYIRKDIYQLRGRRDA